MKIIFASLILVLMVHPARASADFSDPEGSFKLVMQKILDKYIDKNLSKEDLYRAATAGMLSSLNQNEETWNKLLSPEDFQELQSDLAGKVTGIGAEMKFNDQTGYATILKVLPHSPAEKSGVQKDDQILSVEGVKFKGKSLRDLVNSIRGKTGQKVGLKILREDRVLSLSIKREVIPWTPVEFNRIDDQTAFLSIGYFSEETPRLVESYLREVTKTKMKKLVVDLRDNSGGGFDQAVRVAELFLPKDQIIASTKGRDGKVETYRSAGGVLASDVQFIVLTNKDTFCGAELLAAALREDNNSKIIGETTFGKWNAQSVETLPNRFAIKYTIKEFRSPLGHSFQGKGLKPDLEVALPKDVSSRELSSKYETLSKRLEYDTQLKAALEIFKTI